MAFRQAFQGRLAGAQPARAESIEDRDPSGVAASGTSKSGASARIYTGLGYSSWTGDIPGGGGTYTAKRYEFIESFANILLFIPVGFLFGLMIPLRWWPIALLLGPALSAAIELAQRYVLDERVSTVQDVIANSIGASIGVLIAVVIRAIVKARDEQVIARHEAQVRGSTPA